MRYHIGIIIACILILLLGNYSNAQQYLRGKIYKNSSADFVDLNLSDKIIPGVSIHNVTADVYGKADMGGNYRIMVKEGEVVTFSAIGYFDDTVKVTRRMLDSGYNSRLKILVKRLDNVTVVSRYKNDSVERRNEYSQINDRAYPKLVGDNTPSYGFGLTFSPLGYFSKSEKQKRLLKKRLEQEEKDYYIDYKFSKESVARLTLLQGDSLIAFMYRYRPSYDFCRKSSFEDMRMYIFDCMNKEKKAVKKEGE